MEGNKMSMVGHAMIHRTSQVRVFSSRADLMSMGLKGAHINNRQLVITDAQAFKACLPTLAANVADFGQKSAPENVQALSAWVIGEAAQQLGTKLASPQEVYVAIAEGAVTQKLSFPAVNVRGNSLDTARALFKAAIDNNVGALIIEIARSEMGYTNQAPREFAAVIQAAAMLEGFTGPLFLQGDHIQLKSGPIRKGGEAATAELEAHSALIRNLLDHGFGSIDLDMSPFERRTETDLSFAEQQAENAELTARKIADVRGIETELKTPWTTLLGGETGEVGKTNTSQEDIEAYAEGITANMQKLEIDRSLGIRKIAINDGTAHGGIPLPGGRGVVKADIDFSVLQMATNVGRKFGWAGSVQHGASTLPDDAFSLFLSHGAVEVHLATGFQNILFEKGVYAEQRGIEAGMQPMVERFLAEKFLGEWKAGKTFGQFAYSTRKKANGPFKFEFWTMPEDVRAAVAMELYEKFAFLFDQLGVNNTAGLVAQHTTAHDFHRRYPEESTTTTVDMAAATSDEDGELND
jgi:fructose/tagatose bisphosphate aldolase